MNGNNAIPPPGPHQLPRQPTGRDSPASLALEEEILSEYLKKLNRTIQVKTEVIQSQVTEALSSPVKQRSSAEGTPIRAGSPSPTNGGAVRSASPHSKTMNGGVASPTMVHRFVEAYTTDMRTYERLVVLATAGCAVACPEVYTFLTKMVDTLSHAAGYEQMHDPTATQHVPSYLYEKFERRIEPYRRYLVAVDPHTLALELGQPDNRVLEELLRLAHVGMFNLMWGTRCSGCFTLTSESRALGEVAEESTCKVCGTVDAIPTLDQISVRFVWNDHVLFNPSTGKDAWLPQSIRDRIHLSFPVHPTLSGSGFRYHLELPMGNYRVLCPVTNVDERIEVRADPVDDPSQRIPHVWDFKAPPSTEPRVFEHGKIQIDFFPGQLFREIVIFRDFENEELRQPGTHPTVTSAAVVLHHPTFARMFPQQLVTLKRRLTLPNAVYVFASLANSTDMYARLGDAIAAAAVDDVAHIICHATEEHGGRFVKTMGDASLSVHLDAAAAVRSLQTILTRVKEYNEKEATKGADNVRLRVGVHTGDSLMVPANGTNDYIGKNINIACRLQHAAEGGECVLSDAAWEECTRSCGDVSASQLNVAETPRTIHLRGVGPDGILVRTMTV
eukprot:PhM_4_TR665/c0_g1_i1/m.39666